MNELTITRLSTSRFRIKCFTDPERTVPKDLSGLALTFIAKKKLADTDLSAIFTLEIGAGLEIDDDVAANNELLVTIGTGDTATLPVATATTLYCELIATGVERATLGKVTIPVLPSVLQA